MADGLTLDPPSGVIPRRGEPIATKAAVDGELVYAVGDIHGCYDLLVGLLSTIAEDARATAAGRSPILLFAGDYVDRGRDSAKVLQALLWLKNHYTEFELHFLKGNHEAMLLGYLDDPLRTRGWVRVGGAETLESYGVTAPEFLDDNDLVDGGIDHLRARDMLLERMPAAHLRFLQQLELSLQIGDYAFVHAGVRPRVALKKQSEDDLLWIRDDFLEHKRSFGKIIVHGHSWVSDQPVIRDHRIGIDTGAYDTGALTALRLEDRQLQILQASDASVPASGS